MDHVLDDDDHLLLWHVDTVFHWGLLLGEVNPADDGIPMYALLAVACSFLPRGFWTGPMLWASPQWILITALFVLEAFTIFFMARHNFTRNVRPIPDILYCLLLPISYIFGLLLMSIYRP